MPVHLRVSDGGCRDSIHRSFMENLRPVSSTPIVSLIALSLVLRPGPCALPLGVNNVVLGARCCRTHMPCSPLVDHLSAVPPSVNSPWGCSWVIECSCAAICALPSLNSNCIMATWRCWTFATRCLVSKSAQFKDPSTLTKGMTFWPFAAASKGH